jgi:hypothetical protein
LKVNWPFSSPRWHQFNIPFLSYSGNTIAL